MKVSIASLLLFVTTTTAVVEGRRSSPSSSPFGLNSKATFTPSDKLAYDAADVVGQNILRSVTATGTSFGRVASRVVEKSTSSTCKSLNDHEEEEADQSQQSVQPVVKHYRRTALVAKKSLSSTAVTTHPETGISRGGSTRLLERQHDEEDINNTEAIGEIESTATITISDDVAATATIEPIALEVPTTAAASVAIEETSKQTQRSHRRFAPKRRTEKKHKSIAKKLKNRNSQNFKRKIMHASWGLLFAGLNQALPKAKFVPGMAALSSATLIMELLRYRPRFHVINDILHFCLGSSLRKHEMDGKFTGSFYFFTGVTLSAALYSKPCATLGICQLAIADPSASYFGRKTRHVYWSRIENGLGGFGRNKGVLGFLGGAVTCVPFNYRMLTLASKVGHNILPGGKLTLLAASFAMGLAGAFADLAVPTPALVLPKRICGVRVPPFHVDDNFVVPVVSGFACQKVFESLGWSTGLEFSPLLFV